MQVFLNRWFHQIFGKLCLYLILKTNLTVLRVIYVDVYMVNSIIILLIIFLQNDFLFIPNTPTIFFIYNAKQFFLI